MMNCYHHLPLTVWIHTLAGCSETFLMKKVELRLKHFSHDT